jgi:hypothetical protein
LQPWEAIEMGLEVENVDATISKNTKEPIYKPVADYIKAADAFGNTAPLLMARVGRTGFRPTASS